MKRPLFLTFKKVEKYSQNAGTKKVIHIKQEDSVGLHQDAIYVNTMKRKFKKKDWLFYNQPVQPPGMNQKGTGMLIYVISSAEDSRDGV